MLIYIIADDSLFFTLANNKSCKAVKDVLTTYEKISGQAVNLSKSSITFGSCVNHQVNTRMRNLLEIHNEGGGSKYLGLPEQIGGKKSEMFQYIVEKVKEKTQGWNKRFLSTGGKEVLLKAVALGMPVYAMNVYKLTKETCNEISGILAEFWWGSTNDRRKKHWFSWKRLSIPKKEGGLGFRDLENFNLALLGKQFWRVIQHPQSLMARTLKGRYFHDTNILTATKPKKASFIWSSLLHGRDLVKEGLRFIIGKGSTINIWNDPWLPLHPPRPPRPKDNHQSVSQVTDLLNVTGSDWNEEKVRQFVSEDDVETVLSMKLSGSAQTDLLGWHYTKDGIYTVKSAYWLSTHSPTQEPIIPPPGDQILKSKLWKIKTSPKISHFIWRLLSQSLPTGTILQQRHIPSNLFCCRCCVQEESPNHLFFGCPYAQSIWRASGLPQQLLWQPNVPFETKMEVLLNSDISIISKECQHLALWILWRIWKSRNILIFQQKNQEWRSILRLAKCDLQEWNNVNAFVTSIDRSHDVCYNDGARQVGQWKKPPKEWIKCNYDGSCSQNRNLTTIGWILRDEEGVYKGGGQAKGKPNLRPLESEFQALIHAMQHCWIRGYKKVIFEGDNQEISNILQNLSANFYAHNWVRDIIYWRSKFEDVKFQWVPREDNKPAYLLAKRAIPLPISFKYHFFVPSFIVQELHCNHL